MKLACKKNGAPRVIGYTYTCIDRKGDGFLSVLHQQEFVSQEIERRGWRLTAWAGDSGHIGEGLNVRESLREAMGVLDSRRGEGLVIARLDMLGTLECAVEVGFRAGAGGWFLHSAGGEISSDGWGGGGVLYRLFDGLREIRRLEMGRERRKLRSAMESLEMRPRGAPPDEVLPAVKEMVLRMKMRGASNSAIATALNREGFTTLRGALWTGARVKNVWDRMQD